MIRISLDNRNGTVWDLSQIVSEVSLKTSRVGKAGSAQLTMPRDSLFSDPAFALDFGDVIQLHSGNDVLFRGYIFVIEEDQNREVSVTAYDQLRYLLETDTYVKANVTATQVIRDNALAVGLNLGSDLAETEYIIPTFSMDGQKRLDMIFDALDRTQEANKRTYVFYDDGGNLRLRDVDDMTVDVILGDGSLVYGYSHQRDIDTDTYNRIKLVKENRETGKRDTHVLDDREAIERWGRLQYYEQVDESLNEAQIKEMMERLLELKNREQRRFTMEAIGYIGVRAGAKLHVQVKELGIDQYYLVEECTHRFNGQDHTMSLELKVYG